MIEYRIESKTFGDLADDLLASGLGFRFQAGGRSMLPLINDGEILHVQRANAATLKVGDIVLFRQGAKFKAHRIIRKQQDQFITRGDAGVDADGAIHGKEIVGKVVAKECAGTDSLTCLEGWRVRLKFRLLRLQRGTRLAVKQLNM